MGWRESDSGKDMPGEIAPNNSPVGKMSGARKKDIAMY